MKKFSFKLFKFELLKIALFSTWAEDRLSLQEQMESCDSFLFDSMFIWRDFITLAFSHTSIDIYCDPRMLLGAEGSLFSSMRHF